MIEGVSRVPGRLREGEGNRVTSKIAAALAALQKSTNSMSLSAWAGLHRVMRARTSGSCNKRF